MKTKIKKRRWAEGAGGQKCKGERGEERGGREKKETQECNIVKYSLNSS